ncbi:MULTISPECIES: glycosyltransferase [unclassified Streptomyces]|uniref:glycosyltransferase n=1 Tax=unclassified Streptomyces TaxID=2593676 RepID=UPI00278C8A51|nr:MULTISPECIES: glycosyltransferase [unclassified Streptomyces]
MKIKFLMYSADAQAGTAVATQTLANRLAERHDVELVGAFRLKDSPPLRYAPGVRVRGLVDARRHSPGFELDQPHHCEPSRHCGDWKPDAPHRYSLLVERRVAEFLAATDADVVVATTPGTVALLGALGSDDYVKVGQAHTHFHHQSKSSRESLDAAIPRLDAFISVTRRDAETHREHYGLIRTHFEAIPNAVPGTTLRADVQTSRIVTAAGRFVGWKRFDVTVRAFAKAAADHPDWQLRIFGRGEGERKLRALVHELGVYEKVLLMGHTKALREELAKAAIHTSSSRDETFGLTIVEAMACGVPVLSTAGPHGPSEIISPDVDGVLSPVDDVDLFAGQLSRLMGDPELRARLGARALTAAERYDPAEQAERYQRLFDWLAASRCFRPGAEAVVTSGGTLRLTFPECDVPGESLTLRCVRARTKGTETRSFTAEPGASSPRGVTFLVPASEPLPTGTWKVFLHRVDDGVTRPVTATTLQQPVTATARPTDGPVSYRRYGRSGDGQLVVHSRELTSHAEVEHVGVTESGLRVTLSVHGEAARELTGTPVRLVVRGRRAKEVRVTAPGTPYREHMDLDLSWQALADAAVATDDTWDLYVEREGHPLLRVARHGDDLGDKARIFDYPAASVTAATGDHVSLKCYYTTHNSLSIKAQAPPRPKARPAPHPPLARRCLRRIRRTVKAALPARARRR